MGLDTYAVKPTPEDGLYPPADRDHFAGVGSLTGGIFSGNGSGSFRGKVYDMLVEEATGQSLYQ
jgi:hypothetical protein